MVRRLAVLLSLALALLGGCAAPGLRSGSERAARAYPDDPTDAEMAADTERRFAPGGPGAALTAEEAQIVCAAMRRILGAGAGASQAAGCLPPHWAVAAVRVGANGRRARVELGHHEGKPPYPWTGWQLWLVKRADGTWAVDRLWHANIA